MKKTIENKYFAVFFPKIVVRRDIGKRWYDDKGILHINLLDFLLDPEVI